MIDYNIPWKIPYCKLHIIPNIINEKIPGYPFSYEFIGQTLYNTMQDV